MIVHLIFVVFTLTNVITNDEINFNPSIPFFVMKPHTIINQTLHSYCKEQYEFNTQPMFINLTQWPSGFIYSHNPYQKFDDDDDDTIYEECTVELRTSTGNQIRLIFYSMDKNISDDYDKDYILSLSKPPCLRIRDNSETIIYNCLSLSLLSNQYKSDEYLSTTNVIYLELIQPSILINDYDDENNYYQFKLFFTSFTRKSKYEICPYKYLFDCNDTYCVHENSRCNGIDECRTKLDEKFCINEKSNGLSIYYRSVYYLFYFNIILYFNTWTKFILIMTSTWLIEFTSTMKCIRFTTPNN